MSQWFRLFAILLTLPVSAGQERESGACVTDDAVKNPALFEFREQVLRAVKSVDVRRLQPLVDPNVRYEIGERGWKSFSEAYRLTDPKSPIWSQLDADLSLGGRLSEDGEEFCAPYFMCPTWPGSGDETVLAILRSGVTVREKPADSADLIGSTTCGVVIVPAGATWPDAPAGWSAVWLPSQRWGFVESRHVTIAQTSVYLGRRDGRWLLTAVLGID